MGHKSTLYLFSSDLALEFVSGFSRKPSFLTLILCLTSITKINGSFFFFFLHYTLDVPLSFNVLFFILLYCFICLSPRLDCELFQGKNNGFYFYLKQLPFVRDLSHSQQMFDGEMDG